MKKDSKKKTWSFYFVWLRNGWLKDNWFKVGLIILGLVILGGGYLYLNNWNANNNRIEQQRLAAQLTVQKQESCLDLANKFKTDTLKKDTDDEYYSYNIYEFKYNPSTGKCVVAYIEDEDGTGIFGNSRDYEITDLFSGEKILSSFVFGPGQGMVDEQQTFDKAKNEAFTQIATSTTTQNP